MGSDGWKGGPTPAGGHPSAGGDLSKWLERLLFFALFGVFSVRQDKSELSIHLKGDELVN
jgi:hypothetical protein